MTKIAYPAIIAQKEESCQVNVPQFGISLEAAAPAEAIQEARRQICETIMHDMNTGGAIPSIEPLVALQPGTITTLIDVDMLEYMRSHDKRRVRKNVSVPAWLAEEAGKQGVNFSLALQNALLSCLGYISMPR